MDLEDACETGLAAARAAGANAAEAYASQGREIRVQLEHNDVRLGRVQTSSGIGVRVIRDACLGFSCVNSLRREEVRAVGTAAAALASSTPPDANNTIPQPETVRSVDGLYDPALDALPVEEAMTMATEMLRTVRDFDSRVVVDSGVLAVQSGSVAVMNTKGTHAVEQSSSIVYFVMGMARDGDETSSFQYEFDGTRELDKADEAAVAEAMARKAVASLGTRKAESFEGTVVLSPSVVQELMASTLEFAVNANHVQKGMSRLADSVGEAVASPLLTVRDDGTLPGELGSGAFDREGCPHRPFTVVAEGVLQGYLHNAYTATKGGEEGTGHAAGDFRGPPGIGSTNYVIEAGDAPLEEILGDLSRGLLVTRLSTSPNPVSGDFSGVVKGGQLMENGERAYPVTETLIAGNVYEMLRSISAVSKERKRILAHIVPYVAVEGVSVTAG